MSAVSDDSPPPAMDPNAETHSLSTSSSNDSKLDSTASQSVLSRKREREISQEPNTPKVETKDRLDAEGSILKDRPVPSKKTRPTLDSTQEESAAGEGNSNYDEDGSPPLSTSPPHETKIRQISQGVEDISWQKKRQASGDGDFDTAIIPASQGLEVPATQNSIASAEDDEFSGEFVMIEAGEEPTKASEDASPASNAESQPTTSQTTPEADTKMEDAGKLPAESSKRPRDDESDANPRQTKRPTPPPAEETSPPLAAAAPAVKLAESKATPKLGGFMAYASTSSPFATVKGPNIFGAKSPSPSPVFSSVNTPGPSTPSWGSSANEPPTTPFTPAPTHLKRGGFEAFASSASPFASVANPASPNRFRSRSPAAYQRSKSPTRRAPNSVTASAFSSYAALGSSAFAVPASKRARAGSPATSSSRSSVERNGKKTNPLDAPKGHGDEEAPEEDEEEETKQSSFGERLRAGKDEETPGSDEEATKLDLQEQERITGEEEEDTVCSVRGKLYLLSETQWKERGVGMLKVNRRKDGTGNARLVMRKEAVYSLILNAPLFKGMSCFLAQDPRYLRFSVIEDGKAAHYNLKVGTAKQAEEFLEGINSNIPSA